MSGTAGAFGQRCRAEIVALHEFFVDWFEGTLANSAVEFSRFTSATHPNFSMVPPSGRVVDKATVVEGLRSAHGGRAGRGFRIEIRNIVERIVTDEAALLTYEEWQFEGDTLLDSRTSSVWFQPASHAPNGVVWRHVHETMHASSGG